ncbi:MAG TPA: hypothetical protein VFX20_21080 [Steroidobacteraceae bacterium]|nr:hypothetical protein [Steroidobacteraceae bacterium]
MLYSDDREFIFGDGFFHNFTAMAQSHAPKMLAPLTPGIAVLYAHHELLDESKTLNPYTQCGGDGCAELRRSRIRKESSIFPA